ncbi:unnamed protein product [Rhizoctonia solani]|uniref:Uncharacterized protein n=1 Tax=Rhizoctonia solani TaxID=456999 RepID=A0A8H2WWH1_9AGAM|nr:unnamed protein product [Rhizoctonia solani]
MSAQTHMYMAVPIEPSPSHLPSDAAISLDIPLGFSLAMRAFELIVFIWLTIISLAFPSHALSAQCNTASHDHSTPGFITDADVSASPHGPIDIHFSYNHPEFPKQSSYGFEQLVLILWGYCALGLLHTAVRICYGLKYSHGKNSEYPKDSLRQHLGGRTSPVVSCCKPSFLHDLGEAESFNTSKAGTNTSTKIGRGRRFASHGPTLPKTPFLISRNSWDIKEPFPASYGRQVWMSTLAIEAKSDSFDPWVGANQSSDPDKHVPAIDSWGPSDPVLSLGFPARRYPIRASPSQIKPRYQGNSGNAPSFKQARLKYQLVPYLCLIEPKIKCRYQGSTSDAIKTRLSKKKTSLATLLHGDSHFLRPVFFAWFILIVGVDDGLKDPEHDLDFWKKILGDPELKSEVIRLVTLAGNEATPKNIDKALAQLFHDSEALGIPGRTKLFVYITGEGNDQNMMCLPNKETLSKGNIDQWLQELRTTWGYSRPITLVLDICRANKDELYTNMHGGTEFIFSCSPGEKALALKFDRDTPYSSFMLAFVIASPISSRSSDAKFVAAVEQRLEQLTEVGRQAASRWGGELPGSQRPDWTQCSVSNVRFD